MNDKHRDFKIECSLKVILVVRGYVIIPWEEEFKLRRG